MTDADYDRFFREVYPRLVALGLSMSTQRHVAQELAQETMWRAYQQRGELAAYESPYGWCRRVMGNLLIDHHRSLTAERSATERMQARTGAGVERSTPDPADLAAAPTWEELVGSLSVQQRLAATLYYAEDRSVEAVADDMGIAVGTVKSALSKARRNVRRALAAHGGGQRSASDDWEALS